MEQPNSKTRRGRVGRGVAQTLTTSPQQGVVVKYYGIDKSKNNPKVIEIANCITSREDRGVSNRQGEGTAVVESAERAPLRIRKLTPKECFRLMGFEDSDFEKAEAVNSNAQLYKQAGNSIVVPVLEHIISALFDCGAL
jgi:DNA (cytosine-5)-methyltransferase 1